MYNTPIKFDGDIIITDPCYIVKENDNFDDMPYWWDYLSKQKTVVDENGTEQHIYPKASDYPDCKVSYCCALFTEDEAKDIIASGILPESYFYKEVSEQMEKELAAYNKATFKWNKDHEDDWDKCGFGEHMERLGFTAFLSDDTIYGDWDCEVVNTDTKEKIGEFCADAGMVGVFLLDEVMKNNPEYEPAYHNATVIKDFHGTVELRQDGENVKVVGVGNVNFESRQSGY